MDIQLKGADFAPTVENNENVVLDFYADWCGPCQALLPTVHKLAEELKGDVAVKKVNVDRDKALAARFNIRSVPTLVFLKDGDTVDRHTGLLTEKELRERIERLKN